MMGIEIGLLANYLGVLSLPYPGAQACCCRVCSINIPASES